MKIFSERKWRIIMADHRTEVNALNAIIDGLKIINKNLRDEIQILKTPPVYSTPYYVPNFYRKKISEKHAKELKKWAKEEMKEAEKLLGRKVDGEIEIELVFREF